MADSKGELRTVMIGMTGVGKSSLGNSICGAGNRGKHFVVAPCGKSVTKKCSFRDLKVSGRKIRLVDTPGFFDMKMSYWETIEEVSTCVMLVEPGPHALLFVVKIGRFTNEVVSAILTLKAVFGDDCVKFLCIIFTGKDELEEENHTMKEYVGSLEDQIGDLLQDCNGRYLGFNNRHRLGSKKNKDQVKELFDLIDQTVEDNDGKFYTNAMQVEANKIMDEERARKAEEEEKRKRELDEREKKLIEEKAALERKKEEAAHESDLRIRTQQMEDAQRQMSLMQIRMQENERKRMESDRRMVLIRTKQNDQEELAYDVIKHNRHVTLQQHVPEKGQEACMIQ